MRPDALVQGVGCVVMGLTILILHFLDRDHVLLDVSDYSGMSIHLLAAITFGLAPCCVCCGMLMVWHGFGGQVHMGFARCDVLPKASDSDDEERAR